MYHAVINERDYGFILKNLKRLQFLLSKRLSNSSNKSVLNLTGRQFLPVELHMLSSCFEYFIPILIIKREFILERFQVQTTKLSRFSLLY